MRNKQLIATARYKSTMRKRTASRDEPRAGSARAAAAEPHDLLAPVYRCIAECLDTLRLLEARALLRHAEPKP